MSTSASSRKRFEKPKARATNQNAARSSRAAKSGAPDRPFDPAIVLQAREIVASYRLTFESEPDLGFIGSSVEMPGVFADGKTIESCARETLEALTSAIATMLEMGDRPPAPASEGKREQQVNIRLTADERVRIEETARQSGFRSISDYIRHAALRGPR